MNHVSYDYIIVHIKPCQSSALYIRYVLVDKTTAGKQVGAVAPLESEFPCSPIHRGLSSRAFDAVCVHHTPHVLAAQLQQLR